MKNARLARYLGAVLAILALAACAAQSPTNQDVACIYGKLYIQGSSDPVKTHDGSLVECELAKDRSR